MTEKGPRTWQTLSTKTVYENNYIKVRVDQVIRPDGNEGIYGFLEKSPGVFVLIQEGDSFILVNNARYPIKQSLWELSGGVADSDDIEKSAKREVFEETGLRLSKLQHLGKVFLGPGHETTYCDIFCAQIDEGQASSTLNQGGDEAINEVKKFKISEVIGMLAGGQIHDAVLASALAMWQARQD